MFQSEVQTTNKNCATESIVLLHSESELRPPNCCWPAAIRLSFCCIIDACGGTEFPQSVSHTGLTNFTDNTFALRLCTSVRLSSVCLFLFFVSSLGPFFLSVRVSLSTTHPTILPSGAVDKGGQGVAGPSPGTSDSGGGACSGNGAGPSRSDSVRSMVTGGSKAGRWQMVQSHMHAGGLRFSKWVAHGDGGTHEGLQWERQQHGVDIKEECICIMNGTVACTLKDKKNKAAAFSDTVQMKLL